MKTLLAKELTVAKLIPFRVLVPEVAPPMRETFKALVVTEPVPELLVKDNEVRLSLFEEEVWAIDSLPEDKVRSPEVKTSLPEVRVKFLPEARVVSPFKEMAPPPVLKVPVDDPDISKLPETWV